METQNTDNAPQGHTPTSFSGQGASMNPEAVAAYVSLFGPSIGGGFDMFQRGYLASHTRLQSENRALRTVLERLDSYMAGHELWEHGVMDGDPASPNCVTPAKLVRATLNQGDKA